MNFSTGLVERLGFLLSRKKYRFFCMKMNMWAWKLWDQNHEAGQRYYLPLTQRGAGPGPIIMWALWVFFPSHGWRAHEPSVFSWMAYTGDNLWHKQAAWHTAVNKILALSSVRMRTIPTSGPQRHGASSIYLGQTCSEQTPFLKVWLCRMLLENGAAFKETCTLAMVS